MFSGLRRIRRSFAFRLTGRYTLLLLASSAVLLGTVYGHLRGLTLAREHESIELRLRMYESVHARGGLEELQVLANLSTRKSAPVFFVQVADEENRTVFTGHEEVWDSFRPRSLDNAIPPAGGEILWMELAGDDGSLVLASRRLPDGFILRVGRATRESRRVLEGYRGLALVCLVLAVPIGAVGGAVMSHRALAPVRRLTSKAREILTTGKSAEKIPSVAGGDEFDELVRCFNELLMRVEKLRKGLSDSLDHAAHDLRTPLTRLLNSAREGLDSGDDPASLQSALADCVEEAEHVLAVVRRFGDLTEAESGLLRFERRAVDLGRLAADVVQMYEEVAEEKEMTVRLVTGRGSLALVDESAVRRVVANLLENALKFGPPGTEVTVATQRDGGFVELRVADRGGGIPAEEIPLIWHRLYRGDQGLSKPGTGLGLSIVKAVVEAHGGSVHVSSEMGAETVFRVRLPAA